MSDELGTLREELVQVGEELNPLLKKREGLLEREKQLVEALNDALEAVRGPTRAVAPNNRPAHGKTKSALSLPDGLSDAVREAVTKNQAAPHTTQILEILRAAPKRHWEIDQLMALMQPVPKSRDHLMATLSYLYKNDRVGRPKRGRYKHVAGA